jgi:multidrug resistance-associated protein (MRP)
MDQSPSSDSGPSKKALKLPSLVWTLFLCLKGLQLPAMFFKITSDALQFVNPQILSGLIAYVQTEGEYQWHGYALAVILLLSNLLYNILLHQYFHRGFRMGMNCRSMLVSALFNKSLRLSNAARGQATVGEIVNLMAVDVQRFMDLSSYVNMIWSAPFQMILALYFLWQQLGPSVLAGLAVMILLIPINGVLAGRQKKLQIAQMKAKDERLKLVNEMLNSMKVLKLYAWEPPFEQEVMRIRQREIEAVRVFSYYRAGLLFIWLCAPFVISAASFAVFVLSDPVNNILTPQVAFVSLSLFNLLRFPMNMLPTMITYLVQASVASKRITEFLVADELDPKIVKDLPTGDNAVEVRNGSFAWEKGATPVLNDIQLTVPRGSLVAVVGQVGAGKSSLVSAVLGEMDKEAGCVAMQGTKAYVPQQAWIQNATLKNNILFAEPLQSDFYDEVIDACALRPDLEILPGGDGTEIGEKGINLSGGQKQRVSLARAVYQNCDVYLLDDPLSAVDAHVGKHIFEHVIGPEGLLKDKTRILVTHSLTFLKDVDCIVVMKNGRISETGTYDELVAARGAFADVLSAYQQENADEESTVADDIDKDNLMKKQMSEQYQRQLSAMGVEAPMKRRARSTAAGSGRKERRNSGRYSVSDVPSGPSSRVSLSAQSSHPSLLRLLSGREVNEDTEELLSNCGSQVKSSKDHQETPEAGTKLIQTEDAFTGKVKWSVYGAYVTAVGVIPCLLITLAYVASAGFTTGTNVWLSSWSNDAVSGATPQAQDTLYVHSNTSSTVTTPLYHPMSSGERLGGYVGLGLAQGLSVLAASLLLSFFTMSASRTLHKGLIHNLLRSPMSFFDTTPIGRIVNRCGKDIDVIDNTLPGTIPSWLNCIVSVLANIVVVIAATPVFAAVVVPLAIAYYIVQRIYVSSSRQLKRLESLSRSPIYSHFQETITGASSIRAYQVQSNFINGSETRVDRNNMAYYPNITSNRWLAIYLLSMGNIIAFFAALFAVIQKDTLSAGLAGLSISNAMNITQALNWAVRMTSDVETNIVSVERVKEYSETPTEAEWDMPDAKPEPDWPQQGRLQMEHYSVRYRPGLDMVLRDISVNICGGEKVGIVGRTGAGKSSLTLALFRIIEAADGRILIDDLDISNLGLHDVRSKITIIPQDPVLFTGSLRLNLDPFGRSDDGAIWTALELSHLKTFVSNLPDKLNHFVAEGGENLSVGQRQLVCLARALLRKTKILVLDEATAAVDLETDDLIQKTIRETFADCTVLTIAHRLHTIMDNDRVMVLSSGEIAEFDAPNALLSQKDSMFYSMAKNAGLVS